MASYLSMQQRIADELGARNDLATQIQNAIQDAIRYYQYQPTFLNEKENTATTTVAGTAIYTLPVDLVTLYSVYLHGVAPLWTQLDQLLNHQTVFTK